MIGVLLATLWVRFNFTYQLGWEIDFHFAASSIPTAALAALLVSVPAGLLPARRISRLPVLEAPRVLVAPDLAARPGVAATGGVPAVPVWPVSTIDVSGVVTSKRTTVAMYVLSAPGAVPR